MEDKGTVAPWTDNQIDDCVATEVPKDEAKKDSIPNDSIPSDSTKIK